LEEFPFHRRQSLSHGNPPPGSTVSNRPPPQGGRLIKNLRQPLLSLQAQIIVLLALTPNLVWFYMHLFVLPKSAPVTRTMQLAAVHRLGDQSPFASRVQDGFTGLGCLHRRADYWWWINEHSLKLLERLDELKRFRARMKSDPPTALLVDADLRRALDPLEKEVERNYEVVERSDALRYFLLLKKR